MSDSVKNVRTNVYLNDRNASKSLRSLQNEARRLRNQLALMPRDSKKFAETSKDYRRVRGEIRKVNRDLHGVNKGVSGLANGVNKYFNLAVAGIAAFTGALLTAKGILDGMSELADLRADVQKVADLTSEKMDRLQNKLDAMNTRTARSELLELAKQGGKMGESTVEGLADFVNQSNQILVALGEDLGDEAVLQIGKMADIFDESMIKIGSGINAVADNSKANANFLTEWLARLAGTSKELEIAAGDVLGYGATLDELGLKVEMSSTALNNFLMDFTKNAEEMGQAAGFSSGELTKLIGREGTNEGFLAFLQRLRETTNGSAEFLQKLEQIGVDGSRGAQVFLALSQNLDQVRNRQALANEEIAKGTSITEEYNRKNENLAANLEFIGRQLRARIFSSSAMNWIDSLTASARRYLETPLSETMNQERIELLKIEMQLKQTNLTQQRRQELLTEMQERYPSYFQNLDIEKASNKEVMEAIKGVNEQMLNRILLQEEDEKIKDAAISQAQAQRNLWKAEDQARQAIIEATEKYNLNLSDELTLEQKLFEARKQSGASTGDFGVRGAINDALVAYKHALVEADEAEKAHNDSLKEKEEIIKRLGLKGLEEQVEKEKDLNRESEQDLEQSLIKKESLTDDYLKKRQEAEIKINEFLRGINQDEIDAVRQKFEKMLALAEQYGLDRAELEKALEGELLQMRLEQDQANFEAEQKRQIELMENSLQQLFEYEQGQLLSQNETKLMTKEQLDQAMFDLETAHLQRVLEARRAMGLETLEIEQELANTFARNSEVRFELRERDIALSAQQAFMAGALAQNEEDAGKVIINTIRRQITAEIARAIAKMLAKVVGTGPLGLIAAPALGAAAGALFNRMVPSFASGGFTSGTGFGIPDPNLPGRRITGYVHDNEYVVPSEELARPDVQSMVAAIEDLRSQRLGGMAQGGPSPGSTTVNNTTQTIEVAPLMKVTARLIKVLDRIERNGVKAVADQRFRRDWEELSEEDQFVRTKSEL